MSKKLKIGMNGFGRFGLHLLRYWLDRNEQTPWEIDWINDDTLTIQDALRILNSDPYVVFNRYKISTEGNNLVILEPNGARHDITFTTTEYTSIPWLGEPDLFFECSGKNTLRERCQIFIQGNTRQVLISATSWDAETTLVYGYNHEEWNEDLKYISYGSCTVNAFVPFGQWMEEKFGVSDADVNVVHNVADHKRQGETLIRKFCTLEKMAPQLLNWLDSDNFTVNYTVVPYSGVSALDFRFRCRNMPSLDEFVEAFNDATRSGGELGQLYAMDVADIGPEVYNCTTYSTVLIRNNTRIKGDNIFLHGYFDTENSVNRYYDLASYIARRIMGTELADFRGHSATEANVVGIS